MAAANDLRPVQVRADAGNGRFDLKRGLRFAQARASLELMMKRQLELRREETRAIHEFVPVPFFFLEALGT